MPAYTGERLSSFGSVCGAAPRNCKKCWPPISMRPGQSAKRSHQDFSLVDRTSFAVMERLGLVRAASFDNHFAIYRFGRNRDRAFEILR